MSERLRHIMRSAWTSALMGSGLSEVVEPFMDEIPGNEAELGAHHGITLFGLYTLLHALSGHVRSPGDRGGRADLEGHLWPE